MSAALLRKGMVSTEAGFGPCRGLVQSVCQPPVLPRSCLLPGQPQHLANPKLASDAKCSYFTVALLQETGSVYHPSPQKPALSQPRGTPQTPETKGRGRDGCPVWVCLCQIHSLPKLQPSPKSGVKPSPQVAEAEGTRGATYTCTFPSREDAACRELGLPYPCSVADTERAVWATHDLWTEEWKAEEAACCQRCGASKGVEANTQGRSTISGTLFPE